jgi:hypothetical protein
MSFKTTGKVLQILPEIKGTSARGEWKKQDFIIETAEEQFPKKICFTLFNDKNGTFDKMVFQHQCLSSRSCAARRCESKSSNLFRIGYPSDRRFRRQG